MKKTKYEFKGKCSNCGKKLQTNTAQFFGGFATGKTMGFYTICPHCQWEVKIDTVEGKRTYERWEG